MPAIAPLLRPVDFASTTVVVPSAVPVEVALDVVEDGLAVPVLLVEALVVSAAIVVEVVVALDVVEVEVLEHVKAAAVTTNAVCDVAVSMETPFCSQPTPVLSR